MPCQLGMHSASVSTNGLGLSPKGAQSKNQFSVSEALQAAQKYEKRSQGVEQGRLWTEAVTWKVEPFGETGRGKNREVHCVPPALQGPVWAGSIWEGDDLKSSVCHFRALDMVITGMFFVIPQWP